MMIILVGIVVVLASCKTGKEVYKIGDYYPDPKVKFSAPGTVSKGTMPIGVVFWIDPASSQDGGKTGMAGMIVSLAEENTDGKGIKWDDGWDINVYHTEATDMNSGSANMATVANYIATNNKSWNNFPAFNWVVTKMNGQTDYNATRDRWYLPAKNELKMLYAGFSGKVYESLPEWIDGANMAGYDDAGSVEARNVFNQAIVAAGGAPLETSSDPYYWSSVEDYDVLAWVVNFQNGYSFIDPKPNPSRVRAISAF